MNDIITAATSGLFVEVGKIILHMKAQQERIADLERQLAEASAPAVEQQPIQWTYGPNVWKDWCTQYFGPDADDDYLAKAVFNLPTMAQKFAQPAAPQAADTDKVREALKQATCFKYVPVFKGSTQEEQRSAFVELLMKDLAAQAPVREVSEDDGLTGKWCYSTDGEEFQGQCDTEQEAHNEACEYADSGQPYWVGQIKHPADCIGSNRSIGDDIITRADEAAYEECGGDDRAFEFSNEQSEQLGAMVREFIRREGSVNRWAVIDSKQFEAPAAPVQQEGAKP